MDYFLKEFSDKKSRKGRVVQFFTNELSKSLSLTNNLFDLEIGCGHGHWQMPILTLTEISPVSVLI
jgi:hypothetical protein